jgi:polyisoprenoid-binding protein YceI
MKIIAVTLAALLISAGAYFGFIRESDNDVAKNMGAEGSGNTLPAQENALQAPVVLASPGEKAVSKPSPAGASVQGAASLKPGTYALLPTESIIEWSAGKPLISDYVHKGTIGLSAGSLVVSEKTSTGSFTIDMNAIKVLSLGGGKTGKESALESHLKGDNFFASAKFPTGEFKVNSMEKKGGTDFYLIKGYLTLKGVTKPVELSAVVVQGADSKIIASGPVVINRTLWGVTYGSGSFFKGLANNAIDDDIKLTLKLVAK